MPLLVYLDESGDHTLEAVDKDFPLFALAMFICDDVIYNQKIVPEVSRLKTDFFGHEAVILHSREIRKTLGDFRILTDAKKRQEFYTRINKIMGGFDYTLIASVIRKQEHKDRYGVEAKNPYDLALVFTLERLLPLLEEKGQKKVHILAESRGKREDDELMLCFLRTVSQGTDYIPAERFKRIEFRLRFVPKNMNIIGMQLADLAAYPIARHVLNPQSENLAYEVLKGKFYRGKGQVYGLKVFP
ncbi:MAG: DUF3800 domain-containing protein [Candidatus Omnitrophica bacterium]|nr:DUF3800 domain-containing protein [Candidatus Omnitrophota bacterium]